MNLFDMRGAWSGGVSRLYEAVVADGIEPLYARLVDEVAKRLAADSRILDVGCGPGHVAELIARRRPDAEVLGVDLSETMVSRAGARAAQLPNLRIERADACALPFEDGRFDAAISVASIKHWPDPARGVREMARVARSGGTVAVFEADAKCSWRAASNFTAHWRLVPPGMRLLATAYFYRFVAHQGLDARALSNLLSDAGLPRAAAFTVEDMPVIAAIAAKP